MKLLSRKLVSVGFVGLLAGASAPVISCNGGTSNGGPTATGGVGSVDVALVQGGVTLNSVSYTITGPNSFSTSGTINVASSATLTAVIGGIPAGNGYTITLSATGTDGTGCGGSASFNVTAGAVTAVSVTLDCHQAAKTGSVSVNGTINVCPIADGITASPADIGVGFPISLALAAHDPDNGPAALTYSWSAPSGTFTGGTTATPTFVCATAGQVTLTATVSDGDPSAACAATASVVVTCDQLLKPSSLVISTSTYDRTQGAVANLTAGVTPLANTKTATTLATSDGNYVTVWNNEKADASFGVTSPIQLLDLDPASRAILGQITVPPSQVVTSFPSKSEVGLHITKDAAGSHLVFVGYGGAGVGALDVSNADAVANQDPTNPVSFAFGATYAFPRTIVSMDTNGGFVYTPTINYGGNNGRSALLGSNGLYYTVGNANNGDAAAFGAANGTNPDVTETTGVEVVTPINAASENVSIPAGNSAEVDPLLQFTNGGKLDKPGKDDNFRGITEFGGALYFTKGSGSNGMQTVYTASVGGVPALPTVANASSAVVSVVPGFPTDSAKAALADGTSGGNYTPFAVFFGNATTMYVSDEGSGNSTDVGTHAGLQKWTLGSNGQWTLNYVLTAGLIGQVDSGLTGADGAWPAVTTVGLRNLTGVVNGDQVMLWATTSTLSTSGDNGSDPNKVVTITDSLSATALPAGESFSTVIGPTYGTVYRGVAFVNP